MVCSCRFAPIGLCVLVTSLFGAAGASGQNEIPEEYVGAWGDEETCLAYHRGSLFFTLDHGGAFQAEGHSGPPLACHFTVAKADSASVELRSDCPLDDKLVVRSSTDGYNAVYSNTAGDLLFLHKCDFADVIAGIGRDPANVGGDLGLARHITFTFGYATASASICGRQIDGQTTLRILTIGREAAQRYAISIEALPPESWARQLAERRVIEGGDAAIIDEAIIPNFCHWAGQAYGMDGWVVDGLFRAR